MSDHPLAVLSRLRRPKLLIRAARFGLADYNRERDLRRVEIAIIAAWHEAAFSRTKDLPKLAGILARLRRPENKPAMTGEQLFAAIKGMNALMGGKVIHKNTGK